MSNEPPSLAARLEQDGPLPWREAARLAARIARALDRLHAQGKAHGGIEPLTILFVGGTVRLADPLPPALRARAFLAPTIAAGEPPDRQGDFFALGMALAAMTAGDAHAPPAVADLPPPLAAVQRRLVQASGASGYGSGNDVAAALELAIAASEGFTAASPPAASPPPPPPEAEAAGPAPTPSGQLRPAARPPAVARRSTAPVAIGLIGLVLLAGIVALWLRPGAEVSREAPPLPGELVAPEPPARAVRQDSASPGEPAPGTPEATAPIPLDEVLAALPDLPLDLPPDRPDTEAQLQAAFDQVARLPCSRLEVEPSPLGLRLVGSARTAADRSTLLAAIAAIDDVDRVAVALDQSGAHCRVYALLEAHAVRAVPRLADLFPPRPDYRLTASEPLVIRVLTPDFPSHLTVDYFTADGMVVHLVKREAEFEPIEPRTALRIGDPAAGQWLSIAEPFGQELILVVASRAPLFAETRPQIEAADAYLEALEEALAAQPEPPVASIMAIETAPGEP